MLRECTTSPRPLFKLHSEFDARRCLASSTLIVTPGEMTLPLPRFRREEVDNPSPPTPVHPEFDTGTGSRDNRRDDPFHPEFEEPRLLHPVHHEFYTRRRDAPPLYLKSDPRGTTPLFTLNSIPAGAMTTTP